MPGDGLCRSSGTVLQVLRLKQIKKWGFWGKKPNNKMVGKGRREKLSAGRCGDARPLLIHLQMSGFKYKKCLVSRWKRLFEPAVDDS